MHWHSLACTATFPNLCASAAPVQPQPCSCLRNRLLLHPSALAAVHSRALPLPRTSSSSCTPSPANVLVHPRSIFFPSVAMASASAVEDTSSDPSSPTVPAGWSSSHETLALPKMPPDGIFSGFNLLQWRQYMTIMLKGLLMRHLEEDGPPLSDPTYYNWLDIEGVVHRWLLDSISPSVMGEFFGS